MALRWESAESSQVCSKFRLSPAMVRTSRLAARLFALLTQTKWKKVYTDISAIFHNLLLLVVLHACNSAHVNEICHLIHNVHRLHFTSNIIIKLERDELLRNP
jgi:hypothetical protein